MTSLKDRVIKDQMQRFYARSKVAGATGINMQSSNIQAASRYMERMNTKIDRMAKEFDTIKAIRQES